MTKSRHIIYLNSIGNFPISFNFDPYLVINFLEVLLSDIKSLLVEVHEPLSFVLNQIALIFFSHIHHLLKH